MGKTICMPWSDGETRNFYGISSLIRLGKLPGVGWLMGQICVIVWPESPGLVSKCCKIVHI
jgi:hypothetical protein